MTLSLLVAILFSLSSSIKIQDPQVYSQISLKPRTSHKVRLLGKWEQPVACMWTVYCWVPSPGGPEAKSRVSGTRLPRGLMFSPSSLTCKSGSNTSTSLTVRTKRVSVGQTLGTVTDQQWALCKHCFFPLQSAPALPIILSNASGFW